MKLILILVALALGQATVAGEKACVRNYLTGGLNTCESFPKDYTYLVNVDPDATFETCTRKRPASFCEMAPASFLWVVSKGKEKVCVQRFDTEISDLCRNHPQNYSYIWVEGAEH